MVEFILIRVLCQGLVIKVKTNIKNKPTLSEMFKAAKDLNKIFEPEIDINANSLEDDLIAAGKELLAIDKNKLLRVTEEVLRGLDIKLPWPKAKINRKREFRRQKTRAGCYRQAIKELCVKGATKEQLGDRTRNIFARHGGKFKGRVSQVAAITLGALIEFDVLSTHNGLISFNKEKDN